MLSWPMNWKTWASSAHHQSRQSALAWVSGTAPGSVALAACSSGVSPSTVSVNEMGAQSDSGQHHTVRPSTPSMAGAGTPQSMLPVMRNGSRHLPVRKRRPAPSSTSRARSRASQSANSTEKDCCLPWGSCTVWGGSSVATASNSPRRSHLR